MAPTSAQDLGTTREPAARLPRPARRKGLHITALRRPPAIPATLRWLLLLLAGIVLTVLFAARAQAGPVTFQDGLAVVEAEDFDAKVPRSGRDWLAGQSPAGSVAGALQAAPDSGGAASGDVVSTSAELAYRIAFPAAGTYYLWLRGNPPDTAGNSLYLGLDGALGASYLFNNAFAAWGWMGKLFSGPRAAVSVPSAGEHTLHLWMREDGLHLDRLLLAADSSFTPAGNGPTTTPRISDDATPPTLTGRQPAPDATGVAATADVVATFSEPMNPATLTASSLTLAPSAGGPAVSAGIAASAGNTVFTLNPSADLAQGTQYTATVTSQATDAAGNALASPQTWSFTTDADTIAPTLLGRRPAPDATGVATTANVVATFSEPMNPATLTSSSLTLAPSAGGPAVSAGIAASAGNTVFTLDPAASLAAETAYSATVTPAVQDTAGNPLAATQTWSFTTGSDADVTAPTLVDRQPDPGADDVAVAANVVATLSEPIDPASVTSASFRLEPAAGGGPVAAAITPSPDGTSFILNPAADLALDTAYTATLTTAVTDLAGNPLAQEQAWSFTTVPALGSGAVLAQGGLAVIEAEDFDFRIDRQSHGWQLGQSPTGSVAGALRALPDTGARITTAIATTSPEVSYRILFDAPGTYRIWLRSYGVSKGNTVHAGRDGEVLTSAQSIASKPVGAWVWANGGATINVPTAGEHTVHIWMREDGYNLDRLLLTTSTSLTPSGAGPAASPRSGASSDTTPPALVSRQPASGAVGVPVGANVVAGFSEPMDPATITAQSFRVAPTAGGPAVGASIVASPDRTAFTLDPTGQLAAETQYTVQVTTAAHDAAGNPLASEQSWSFTTASVDVTAPTLVNRAPAPGAVDVNPIGAKVVATFSEAMNPASITTTSFSLAPTAGGPTVAAAISASSGNTVFTLEPPAALEAGTSYSATITTAATDAAGNPLAAPQSWSFVTDELPTATQTEITTGEILGAQFNRRLFYQREGGAWIPTYPRGNAAAAGKLMNFRAANAIFDDENRSDDDPAANTAEFISHFDEYRARGILAYTVSLQGGFPGYEGALASAFQANGALKQPWLDRAAQVIEAADARGQVVILTYFYQRQDQRLTDGDAVRAATVNATDWLIQRGYRNVIIEIANEYNSALYDQEIITENRAVNGVAELITLAKSRFDGLGYRLPVSVSSRDLTFTGALRAASDLALPHGNLSTPSQDAAAVAALVADATVHGPVVMNEDFNGFDATQSNLAEDTQTATGVFNAGGSWGLMWQRYNQDYPFQWALGPSTDISGGSRANYFRAVLDHVGSLTGEDLPPAVVAREPASGALGVAVGANVRATFSKAMDPATLTGASFILAPAGGGAAVEAVIMPSAGDTAFTLDPAADLAPGTAYTATVTTAATDAAGNPLAAEQSWSFTTASPDTTPPTLAGRQPAPGATGVAVSADVAASFSEAMDPATLSAAGFTLAPAGGGAPVAASVSASAGDTVFTLDPSADLAAGAQYTATVSAGAADAAGNPLAAEQSWSFTTAAAPAPGAGAVTFQGGLAVVEAEDDDVRTARSGKDWVAGQSPAGSVAGALQAAPDSGVGITSSVTTTSPEVAYRIAFPAAGTYYLWLRGNPPDTAGNSLYLGLDGALGASYLFNNAFGAWGWMGKLFSGPRATVSVPSAGEHTVHLWMREDGLHLDRLLLTADVGYAPAGTGPAATPRQ